MARCGCKCGCRNKIKRNSSRSGLCRWCWLASGGFYKMVKNRKVKDMSNQKLLNDLKNQKLLGGDNVF